MQLPEDVVFWIPRFPPNQSWPVSVSSARDSLDLRLPLPPILIILFLTLLGILLYAVVLKDCGSLYAYRRALFLDTLALNALSPHGFGSSPGGGGYIRGPVSHCLLPFFGGGLFAFEFYPDADWQRSLLVFVILSGVLRPCFYIWFVCWACPWATLFPNNVLPYWVSPLGRFPLRPLALGPPVGVLAPGFNGRWGMGTVFRFLISGASTFGFPFSRILWTLLYVGVFPSVPPLVFQYY